MRLPWTASLIEMLNTVFADLLIFGTKSVYGLRGLTDFAEKF